MRQQSSKKKSVGPDIGGVEDGYKIEGPSNPSPGVRSTGKSASRATPEAYLLSSIFRMNDVDQQQVKAAQSLINEYGSLAAVLSMSHEDAFAHPALGPWGAINLEVARRLIHQSAYVPLKAGPVFDNFDKLIHYLLLVNGRSRVERFILLSLDVRGRLIDQTCLASGTKNFVAIDAGSIVSHALRCFAHSIILVHNHPSGDPSPSQQDIDLTIKTKVACELVGVAIRDHIIVAGARWSSLRAAGWSLEALSSLC